MKRAMALVLTILAILVLLGCSNGRDERYLIGVLQPSLMGLEHVEMKKEISETISEYANYKCLFADAGNSVEKQITDIDKMINWGVDAIIVVPCDEQRISDKLKEAVRAGIYIILIGYAPYDVTAFSIQLFVNNYKIGFKAGEYACQALGGEGVVLELQDNPQLRTTQERKKGFRAAISKCPGIVKEYVVVGYGLADTAVSALLTSEILENNPRIDLVYSHNGEMSKGAAPLFRNLGYKIKIVEANSVNLSDERASSSKHKPNAMIVYPTLGVEAVTYAMKLIAGETFDKCIEFEPRLITEFGDEE